MYVPGSFGGENVGQQDFIAIKLDFVDGTERWRWQDGTMWDDELHAVVFTHSTSEDATVAPEDESIVLAGYSAGHSGEGFSTDTPGLWTWVPHFTQNGDMDFAAVKLTADGVEEWRWQVG